MKHSNDLNLDASVIDRLSAFCEMVAKWTRTVNLIAPNDCDQLWDRHIADSLQLIPLMSQNLEDAADLGSGGGFPGLVLAVATGRHFHLVESDARKATFLKEASRTVGASTTIHQCRIEAAILPPVGVITARALAPLTQLIALALPHMGRHTVLLAPKGAKAADELTIARKHWRMMVRSVPSQTDPRATIFHLSEIEQAPPDA